MGNAARPPRSAPAAPSSLARPARTALRRGTVDIAIAGLLFHGGLRRSEAADLTWEDVRDSAEVPGALLVTVRASKSNRDGSLAAVRMVKGGYAAAIRALREAGTEAADPAAPVLGGASVGRRLRAAARAAGIPGRITGHSGRVGLASELTVRGASTADVMRAGGWSSARMVARYSAGALAENGAVARYL